MSRFSVGRAGAQVFVPAIHEICGGLVNGRDGQFAKLDELFITQPAQESGGATAAGEST